MKKKKPEILWAEILEAKPNPLFTEQQRLGIRFLRYSQAIPCAECGEKRRVMWTCLYQFKVMQPCQFSLQPSMKSHLPITPVCAKHIMAPDFPKARHEKPNLPPKTKANHKAQAKKK